MFSLFIINVHASYVVYDKDQGRVLYGSNIHERKLIASITKVMTAYVVINNTDLNKEVTVGDEINLSHGSSIYLKKGERIKIIDLLYGLLLRSGNDAAEVLAKNTFNDRDKFIEKMNDYAKEFNMVDTRFYNPSGLDDTNDKKYNISSAYDMAIITSKAMDNPMFKKIFGAKKYKVTTNMNVYEWYNKNKTLFMSDFITGGKTGYTKKAHRTLITSAYKNDMNLVIVTLDFSDDFNFHINNYNNVFNTYKKYLIINKNNLGIKNKLISKKNRYILFTNRNYYYVTNNKSELKSLKLKYIFYNNVKISNYSNVGKLFLYKDNKIIYEDDIYIYHYIRR